MPVRALAEALGFKVEWDGITQTVILSSYNKVCITSGNKYHLEDCYYLKEKRIYVSKEDAELNGFTPCKKCFEEN